MNFTPHRQAWFQPVSLIFLAWLGSGLCAVAETAAVALLPDTGAATPSGGVLSAIESTLLRDPAMTMVDRASMARILAEQTLHASGFTKREDRIRLGALVPATIMVFVGRVPGSQPPLSKIQITESRSGIVLGLDIWEDAVVLRDSEAVCRGIQDALAKVAVPAQNRHFVGLLGFRSEVTAELDATAEVVGDLLMSELNRITNVVVLDRDHLGSLLEEKKLTDIDQQIRATTWILEGGIKHNTARNLLDASIMVTPPGDGKRQVVTRPIDRGRLHNGVRELGLSLSTILAVEPPPLRDPAKEISAYAMQIDAWRAWGNSAKATRAAEVLYALQPNIPNARTLITWLVTTSTKDIGKIQRAMELYLEYLGHVQCAVTSGITNTALQQVHYYSGPEEGPDVESRRDRLIELEEEVFRGQLAYHRQHYRLTGEEYWLAWGNRLRTCRNYHSNRTDKQVALIREAVQAYLTPPGRPEWYPTSRLNMLTHLLRNVDLARKFGKSTPPAYRDVFLELARHQDPFIRMIGCRALLDGAQEWQLPYTAYHTELVSIWARELPAHHPYRSTPLNDAILGTLCLPLRSEVLLIFKFPATTISNELDSVAAILRDSIGTGDPERLNAIGYTKASTEEMDRSALFTWIDNLAYFDRTNEVASLLRDLWVVANKPGAKFQDTVRAAQSAARQLAERHTPPVQQASPKPHQDMELANDKAWDDYEVIQLEGGIEIEPFRGLPIKNLILLSRGNRLYCLRYVVTLNQAGDGFARLRASEYWLPTGELMRDIDVPELKYVDSERIAQRLWAGGDILCGTLASDTLYVGRANGFTALPLNGLPARTYTSADGLPGAAVISLASLSGGIYFCAGFHPSCAGTQGNNCSVLGLFTPANQQFHVLASERALERRTALDGQIVTLSILSSDEHNRILWLDSAPTRFGDRKPDRYWKLNANDGSIAEVARNDLPPDGPTHPDALSDGMGAWISVIAPGPGKQISEWQPAQLRLARKGEPDAVMRCLPDGRPFPSAPYLHSTCAGLVLVFTDGTFYRIRHRALLDEYQTRELQAKSGNPEETALLSAAKAGNAAQVRALLDKGVNIHATQDAGWTALHYACARQQRGVVDALLHKGADPSRQAISGQTPLYIAAATGDADIVELLLDHAADPDGGKGDYLPLLGAVAYNHLETCRILLREGASTRVRFASGQRDTLLDRAMTHTNEAMVQLLQQSGVHAGIKVAPRDIP